MRASISVLFVSAILIAAGSPASADPPLGVAMALGFPSPIQMFGGGEVDPNRTQDVTAEYEFTSLTNGDITLNAANDCAAHTWTVTDATGAVVDHSADCPATGPAVTVDVPPGKPIDGQSLVSLHVFDYKEGQTYTLHYKAFGAETTGNFTVTLLK